MKWQDRRQSDNVEDRRGMSIGGNTVVRGGIIRIIILLIIVFGGENAQMITPVLEQMNQGQSTPTEQRDLTTNEIKMGEFPKIVFADTEDIWTKIFKENGMQYKELGMVLLSGTLETACEVASSESGPFYCSIDEKVYMDLDFFDELQTKFGAKGGDFATA